jgi:putative SOS response-associated peptidase YedK
LTGSQSGVPLFYNARAKVTRELEPHDGDGFPIIIAVSDLDMVDIPDCRPLALTPELANEWLDRELSHGRGEIAAECCWPVDELPWYPVGDAAGDVENQGPDRSAHQGCRADN